MVTTILELFHHYGYLIFYFAFLLGPFGIPIPNEITIISGAILSNTGVINSWVTYFCILTGLLTAITVAYFAGKIFGPKIHQRFQHHKHFIKAEEILNKYGHWAMCISLFIPIVRYILPIVVGLSGIRYRRFVLISYSSALLWTITYFTVGTYFGTPILSAFK